MEEQIDKAVDITLKMVRTNLKPDEVLKVTQAILNLAHAKTQLLGEQKPTRTKGSSA